MTRPLFSGSGFNNLTKIIVYRAIYTRGVQYFLSVGPIANFAPRAGPRKKIQFIHVDCELKKFSQRKFFFIEDFNGTLEISSSCTVCYHHFRINVEQKLNADIKLIVNKS